MTLSELARESTTIYFFSFKIRSLPPDPEHSLVSSPGLFFFIEPSSNPREMPTAILESHGGREQERKLSPQQKTRPRPREGEQVESVEL